MKKNNVKEVKEVVLRFSGDSGDGMQLTGTIFSNLVAMFGNQIATHPDFPSEIRAPLGTVAGVSGFQIKLGTTIFNSGDKADVLVAMNPAALKVCSKQLKKDSIIIVDIDSFLDRDLKKANLETDDPFLELGLTTQQVLKAPISSLTKESLKDFDIDMKSKLRSKNMFALGIICWLFNHDLQNVNTLIENRFTTKPNLIEINEKALLDGYNFAHNQHLNFATYRVQTCDKQEKGRYIDVNGNQATAWGLIAASEISGKNLFLGSYPITPATDILHELAQLKFLNVKTVQAEDEIAAVAMSLGASFAGNLAATSTSGPGLALKSEAIGLAVMAELPLVIVDVQRGGPSTGLPTKTEQTDLKQALYGRSGEAPLVVLAAGSPADCFTMAFWACKLAMEHMTPVILLTDSYIANGTAAWKIPDLDLLPSIVPHDVALYQGHNWNIATRDAESLVKYWATPGTEKYQHRIGGLENHVLTGGISTDPENHQRKVEIRRKKILKIVDKIPPLVVDGKQDAETLVVCWGGTKGHVLEAVNYVNNENANELAFVHFSFIYPLPSNTETVLRNYSKIIVVEQNEGQFAGFLKEQYDNLNILKVNKVNGQPFSVEELTNLLVQNI